MNKFKNLIKKVRAKFYGTAARVQFPEQLTVSVPAEDPLPIVQQESVPHPTEKASGDEQKSKRVAPAKKSTTPTKKPGRPKGSISKPKN